MKLLATLLPRVRRLVPSAERGLSVALLGFLVGVEFAGYHASTEFHDALAGTSLIAVAIIVLGYHRSRPLRWVDSVRDRLAGRVERLEQLKYDIGIDFRGDPPLPRKLPRFVPISMLVLAGATGLGFAAWDFAPQGWRDLGVRASYVLYVVALMLLWALLTATIVGGVLLPVTVLDQRMRAANGEAAPGPPDAVVVAGYALLVILVACVTPPVYAASLALVAIGLGIAGCFLPTPTASALLWRPDSGRKVYAIPLRRLVAAGLALAGLFVVSLIAWACGGRLLAAPSLEAAMPVTVFLGTLVAWLLPGVAAVLAYLWLDFRRNDPARVSPPVVHLAGGDGNCLAAVRRWGFDLALGRRTGHHIGLTVVPEDQSQAAEFQPNWPLNVSRSDLDGTLVKERVARRDELLLRRQFFKALAKLVKKAKAATPTRGGGYLIAPQYWFITGILWADPEHGAEADEDSLRPLGPTYRRSIPVRARQYFHRVLTATQIDAIYLEDGVGHRKLEKVLRAALELYDIHGGRRRAEDHHFHGLPNIRVVIHDYAPGNPFHLEEYPEPKFDDVSRSRVLHIFKDRGDSEELMDAPFDFSWEPMPLTV